MQFRLKLLRISLFIVELPRLLLAYPNGLFLFSNVSASNKQILDQAKLLFKDWAIKNCQFQNQISKDN
jgi:hypothetical protein